MTGRGRAHGAITIVNATATGIGCALAVRGGAEATWTPATRTALHAAADDRLVRAVAAHCADLTRGQEAEVSVTCTFPPARGLKTSSSVGAALVRAAAASAGHDLPDADVEARAVAAARLAGVTLTGAYDDQCATVRGGCHGTDTAAQRILTSPAVHAWHVAVWVPDAEIPKASLRGLDVSAAAPGAREAIDLAREGRLAEALTRNGRSFHAVYAAAGLPVDDEATRVALALGALGAGLSGTGPAVAALFDQLVVLPEVPGGTWRWTEAVA